MPFRILSAIVASVLAGAALTIWVATQIPSMSGANPFVLLAVVLGIALLARLVSRSRKADDGSR